MLKRLANDKIEIFNETGRIKHKKSVMSSDLSNKSL